jgi:cephalosporin-C deacetylase-like acetyl esterase
MPIPSARELERRFARNVRLEHWRRPSRPQSGPVVFTGAKKQLFDDLVALIAARETQRRDLIASLRTKAAILKRASWLRREFRALAGLAQFPPRTALKPRVEPGFTFKGGRVERIIFESRPEYFVTGNLYLPDQVAPLPAVLQVCGHAAEGKYYYQDTSLGLARRGLAVLTIDPPGQGERDEYTDRPGGRRTIARCCRAHTVAGDPAYLVGSSFAAFRLWDSIRALDYLQSRADIDGTRLGVTGRSGGGWESLWLSAIDSRISAVNSNCFLTTLRRRVENRHEDAEPDPEQDAFGILARGIDQADLLLACIPTCAVSLGATIFDFFPIDGALQCFREVALLFERCGRRERIAIEVADAGHANTPAMQQQCFDWLARWLSVPAVNHHPSPPTGADPDLAPVEKTFCTPTGIVLTSLGGKTTAQIIAERARELALQRKRKPLKNNQLAATVRRLLKLEPVTTALEIKTGKTRSVHNAIVTPLRIRSEREIWLTAHLWLPADPARGRRHSPLLERRGPSGVQTRRRPAVIFLSEKPGSYNPLRNKTCARLAAAGQLVLDFDPRGMAPYDEVWLDSVPLLEATLNYDAILLGRPLAGMRVADVLRAVDFLWARPDVDRSRIDIYGDGYGALLALFAATVDPRITKITERNALQSYDEIVFQRDYAWPINMFVPEILLHCDLPDLRRALKSRRQAPQI